MEAGIVFSSAIPVFQMLLMGLAGAVMGRKGTLDATGRHTLSQLIFWIFVPCLTFTKLARSVDLANLTTWWYLPFNISLSIGVGFAMGWVAVLLLRPPTWLRPHIMCALALGNVGNLPMVLVTGLCKEEAWPFKASFPEGNCAEKGVAYVAFGMWVGGLAQFAIAYNVFQQPPLRHEPPPAIELGSCCEQAKTRSSSQEVPAWEFITRGSPVSHKGPIGNMNGHMTGSGPLGNTSPPAMLGCEEGALAGDPSSSRLLPCSEDIACSGHLPLSMHLRHGRGTLDDNGSPRTDGDSTERPVRGTAPGELSMAGSSTGGTDQLHHMGDPGPMGAAGNEEAAPLLQEADPEQAMPSFERPRCQETMEDVPSSSGLTNRLLGGVRASARTCWSIPWASVLNLPTCSALAGIAVGCLAPVKDVLFGKGTPPLRVVGDSLDMLGSPMIPCMMLLVGAVLNRGPTSPHLPARLILGVIVFRLVLMPLFGMALVLFLEWVGIFKAPDPLFHVVLMMVHGMPTAIQLNTVATLRKSGEAEVSTLLFWQYMACLVTMPLMLSCLHLIM
eukprot:jgi/Botrbrau1/10532/Bobra.7_1s0013.1